MPKEHAMTQDLIRYPFIDYERGEGWRDSGEGGLFFYAVWDNATPANCSVDASPALHMADVLVGAHGPLAKRFDEQREAWRAAADARDYERAYIDSGISFDTVLLLGTTSASLFYDDYFQIRDLSDLTEAGRGIVQAISAAMGTEPTFVSYLDT
jgi:hypothetical protein